MKIYGPDNHELVRVTSLAKDGNDLVIHGKIFGTMQLSARVRPEEARAGLKLLTPRTLWLLLTLMFRRGRG